MMDVLLTGGDTELGRIEGIAVAAEVLRAADSALAG